MPKPNQQVQDSPDFSKRLRKLQKNVDFNVVKAASASGFTESTVPDGRYQFVPMSRSGIKPAKNDRLYDTWQFLIVDGGEQDAQVLYKTLWFEGEDDEKTQKSLGQIVRMLNACGYEVDDIDDITAGLDDLMETKPLLTGQVRWNSYTDRTGTARRQQNVYVNSADFEDTWADQDLFAYGSDEKKVTSKSAVTTKTKKAAAVSSEEEEEEDEETPVKRGRGRPKGSTNKSTAAAPAPTVKAKKKAAPAPVADDDEEEDEEEEPVTAPKRGRGRPPKNPATPAVAAPAEDEDEEDEDTEEESTEEEEAEEDLDINDVIRFKNKAGQTVEGPIESFDESDPDNPKAVVKKDGKIYRVTFDQLEKVS